MVPLGVQPAAVIPFDPALFGLAANNGQMVSEPDAKHEIAQMFDTLASVLTGRRDIEPQEAKGIGSLIQKLKARGKK